MELRILMNPDWIFQQNFNILKIVKILAIGTLALWWSSRSKVWKVVLLCIKILDTCWVVVRINLRDFSYIFKSAKIRILTCVLRGFLDWIVLGPGLNKIPGITYWSLIFIWDKSTRSIVGGGWLDPEGGRSLVKVSLIRRKILFPVLDWCE